MKKQMISVCAATVLAASMLAGGAVQAFAAPAQPADETAPAVISEENCVSDSWKRAADPTVTTKVRKLLRQGLWTGWWGKLHPGGGAGHPHHREGNPVTGCCAG